MEKKTLPYLPHELIIQILQWLPVKSLIRFKCVCKSWFSLISDQHFAAAIHTHKILLMSTSHLKSLSIDFEASLNDGRAYASQNLKFMLRGSYFDLKIIGSCRGFVLLHCSFTIYLWNPSTGFHKRIPLSPYGCNSFVNYFYGFGYDHSRDDYLMVSISHYANLVGIISHLEIFSLRDNTWKQMEGTHFPYTNVSYGDPQKKQGRSLMGLFISWLFIMI
ncbi:putative F-box domain, galactose oxidase/kelch, beta-propeller, F-box associated interaction [Medicago truncatula]|uniref:Putative F-box domain, galactose oxidase/kelch, beta-propeller, F-box associated interaction n=1 Tax=Medicago truncatula TaxID=3880 RepID=A0A396IF60_MEDTR|nr:putative F-box domain, galactose oxidase/kelch, beta-propeller, F-box associated interaction [Medicago truncatula]